MRHEIDIIFLFTVLMILIRNSRNVTFQRCYVGSYEKIVGYNKVVPIPTLLLVPYKMLEIFPEVCAVIFLRHVNLGGNNSELLEVSQLSIYLLKCLYFCLPFYTQTNDFLNCSTTYECFHLM